MQICMRLYADVHTMSADVGRLSAASAQIESLLNFLKLSVKVKLQNACKKLTRTCVQPGFRPVFMRNVIFYHRRC